MVTVDLPNYDKWKLASPYDTPINLPVQVCANCQTDLYENQSVLFDSGETYFCDDKCAKEYIIKNIEHFADDVIRILLNKTTL